ncbi:MAG: aldo/keto reductase [Peptococcaceae bacterium]|jgi:predicted aldo/keto reductase-like oxidoreductase|nr:aldo/keto reductase [Peptococcaceae bacterium]
MLYRTFGKTNERVSILGFGCMRLPVRNNNPSDIDEEQAIPMIRYAIDSGVNYVDTAYPYHGTGMESGGSSEPFVAKALKDGYRQRVHLATKLPTWLIKTQSDMDRYLDEQLRRLETDHIDFYLIHSLNQIGWPAVKAAGIQQFLDRALQDGRIRYAGFSFHDKLDLFKEIVDDYDWSFCQIQYNYLDQHYQAGVEGLQYAAHKGLGVTIMEPIRGGNLAKLPDNIQALFDQSPVKRSAADWALRWVWNHPEVSVVLSGMTAMEHVVENVQSARDAEAGSVTAEQLALFDQARDLFKARIKVPCTGCGYCMPCPTNIDIPVSFASYNNYWIHEQAPAFKFRYLNMTRMNARASDCVECGQCESHCPQGLSIREELKKVAAAFEN